MRCRRRRKKCARASSRSTLDLKLGSATATILTCDLSYDYVKINAEYTT